MTTKTLTCFLTGVLALAQGATAGDLTPAGPPAPTMKTLTEVEPRTPIRNDFDTLTPVEISASGSYYLVEDIHAFPGQNGILINAPNVTLDLNGFGVIGNLEVLSLNGIILTSNARNVTIRNGSVRNFPLGSGISTNFGAEARIDSVTSRFNGVGFELDGGAIVINSVAHDNSGIGFDATTRATLESCLATSNGDHGFRVWNGSVRGSVANNNEGDGFSLLSSTITDCAARDNEGRGFHLNSGTAASCQAYSNTTGGYFVEAGTVRDSYAAGNPVGFEVAFGAGVVSCAAASNTGDGFLVSEGNLTGCTAENNGGAGFNVTGSESRIDSCHATDNGVHGFLCTGSDNLFIRNSAAGAGVQYDIGAGNAYGPLVFVSGAGDISGIAAAAHPWANLRH